MKGVLSMLKMFTIKDIKANIYNTPFFSVSSIDATRNFIRACNDQNTQLCNFPEDFELFFFGVWDEDRGKLTMTEKPEFVISGIQAIQSMKKPEEAMKPNIPLTKVVK